MILISDEINGCFIDVKLYTRLITDNIKKCRKDIDSMECPSRMPNLLETLDLIATYQNRLQDLIEMQKIPFDVLVVVQQKNESHIDCSDIDMTKRVIIQ